MELKKIKNDVSFKMNFLFLRTLNNDLIILLFKLKILTDNNYCLEYQRTEKTIKKLCHITY